MIELVDVEKNIVLARYDSENHVDSKFWISRGFGIKGFKIIKEGD